MIGQIAFTVAAFILFISILVLKLIKKNDTTYIIILGMQALGILLNLIRISFNLLTGKIFTIMLYILCIIIPIGVLILEIKRINTSEILRIVMAKAWLFLKKPKKAKGILIELVRKYDDSYMGHKMLAHIYEEEGGMRKAIDEYVRVLEIRKNDYKSYYEISVLLNELGQKEEAIEMLNTLLKNRPQTYEASEMLGRIYLEKKEFKKAIEIYTNSMKYDGENYDTYYNLGICYARINDFNISKQCFEKAVKINEDMYLAYYRLGQIALLYREFDVAEENFIKSAYNEKEAKAYYELSKIHMIKNQKEKAIEEINNTIKLDTSYYKKAQTEPIFFPIKAQIVKPEQEVKSEYSESQEELEIEDYLNDTYNLTKTLNKQ